MAIKFYYKLENQGTELCFTIDGLDRALRTGSWYLPWPQLCGSLLAFDAGLKA